MARQNAVPWLPGGPRPAGDSAARAPLPQRDDDEVSQQMPLPPLEDEYLAFYTVGQVASMLDVQQAFLRRIDEHRVVSPQRSAGGQRRYSRRDMVLIQQVVTMMGEGMTLAAIRRIIELEHELADVIRERDELARQLARLRRNRQA
jgi:MerR family transcriptional regulator, heat shock protein HspR